MLLSFVFISACSQELSGDGEVMPGSDRDAHGCMASAGYSWCPRTVQCERPWELAEEHGFDITEEAYQAFCQQGD
ncbi:hypothetical protein [Marinicella pacifica]|nr:hypothetical protein [Marinicella pacifica]